MTYIPRLSRKFSKKIVGQPPGTIVFTGEKKDEELKITIIDYNLKKFTLKESQLVVSNLRDIEKSTIRWINIKGLHNPEIIEQIGNQFDLHPLLLEDIEHIEQRSKIDNYEDHYFVVLKMLYLDKETEEIEPIQVSLVFGEQFVLTFQEREIGILEIIRQRLKSGRGRIRKMKSDYLAYCILDAIIDNYFVILENMDDKIETLEDELIEHPTTETLQNVYKLKRGNIIFRKSVWPLREVINRLQREETDLIKEETKIYIRDLYDHTIQIIDTVENFRDILGGMMDLYLSSISNKMNEIMKVLTIISTIFIPITFIAGVYGMNFLFMPELQSPLGYPITWIVMIIIAIILLFFFKRKKWL